LNLTDAQIANLSSKYDYQSQYAMVQYTMGALRYGMAGLSPGWAS
jgi:hypothetical protein